MVSMKSFKSAPPFQAYGNSTHPQYIPGRQALVEARMQKAVELLVVHPAPTISVMAEELEISRASVYRLMARPDFQALLARTLDGRMASIAKSAFDTVERIMREGSPGQQLKAATWLLERWDKLREFAGISPAALEEQKSLIEVEQMIRDLRPVSSPAQDSRDPAPDTLLSSAAGRTIHADDRALVDRAADAELDETDLRASAEA